MTALIVFCLFVYAALAAAAGVGWLTWVAVESEFRTFRSLWLVLALYASLILWLAGCAVVAALMIA